MDATLDQNQSVVLAQSRLTFDDYVLQKIANQCAQEVDGILGMDGNMVDSISETFGNERLSKGISVEVDENQVTYDMSAILSYDADARAVFKALCHHVETKVKQMTGLQVLELNLHVSDMMTRREWQKANS
ncbi:Asp23/Gls24 family envelope stress response protein [Lacticaseibacillus brantae]|uniref:Stress response regulator gls24 homolog n=1 Tax=Lacticaseibacillus brantae DSM 23927 TaxID=1423727 RepID=A0A0R2AX46_9LACO|nr:Asp23/Gls24 family envelope stress response protein [Lacticaseibacillus brantae]KRM71998.1 hypothetical protein FC34_GL000980 [Lacticaseibacillus brantae DSM 23927]